MCPTLNGSEYDGIGRHGTSKTEITQLDASIGSDQHILRFHVAVYDAVGVEIVKGFDQLFGDLLDGAFGQSLVIL